MAPDYSKPPYSFFAPPGIVKISEPALQMARRFFETISETKTSDWIISFDWAESRFFRKPAHGPRIELGAGLDIVAYDRVDVPSEVIQSIDGLDLAIKIPSSIYEKSTLRLIDVDETEVSKLTLR
jgi:hypothetical protein